MRVRFNLGCQTVFSIDIPINTLGIAPVIMIALIQTLAFINTLTVSPEELVTLHFDRLDELAFRIDEFTGYIIRYTERITSWHQDTPNWDLFALRDRYYSMREMLVNIQILYDRFENLTMNLENLHHNYPDAARIIGFAPIFRANLTRLLVAQRVFTRVFRTLERELMRHGLIRDIFGPQWFEDNYND